MDWTHIIDRIATDHMGSIEKIAISQETQQFIEWVLMRNEEVSPVNVIKFLERQNIPFMETKPSKRGLPLAKGEMVQIKAEKCKRGDLLDLLKPVNEEIATVIETDGDDVILDFAKPGLKNMRIDGGVVGPDVGLYRYTPAEAALSDGRNSKLFEVVYIADKNAKPPSPENIKMVQDYIDKGLANGENRQRCYYTGLILGIYESKEGHQFFKIFSQQRDHFPRALNPYKGIVLYIGRLNQRPNWKSDYQKMIQEYDINTEE